MHYILYLFHSDVGVALQNLFQVRGEVLCYQIEGGGIRRSVPGKADIHQLNYRWMLQRIQKSDFVDQFLELLLLCIQIVNFFDDDLLAGLIVDGKCRLAIAALAQFLFKFIITVDVPVAEIILLLQCKE